jgi:hypothetical protein
VFPAMHRVDSAGNDSLSVIGTSGQSLSFACRPHPHTCVAEYSDFRMVRRYSFEPEAADQLVALSGRICAFPNRTHTSLNNKMETQQLFRGIMVWFEAGMRALACIRGVSALFRFFL